MHRERESNVYGGVYINIYIHDCIHILIHTYACSIHIYIYTHTYIYPPPRFARLVWPDFNVAFRLLLSDCFAFLLNRGPPWSARPLGLAAPSPLWAALGNHCFCYKVIANTHYFALWIHHTIHKNLDVCSTSLLIFTCSLSCKNLIFRNSLKNNTNRKSTNDQKQQGLLSKKINLGVTNHLPK